MFLPVDPSVTNDINHLFEYVGVPTTMVCGLLTVVWMIEILEVKENITNFIRKLIPFETDQVMVDDPDIMPKEERRSDAFLMSA
jgi:hypothetical protein